jgi:hypothetical protein
VRTRLAMLVTLSGCRWVRGRFFSKDVSFLLSLTCSCPLSLIVSLTCTSSPPSFSPCPLPSIALPQAPSTTCGGFLAADQVGYALVFDDDTGCGRAGTGALFHSTLYTLHSALYTLHSTLCTLHSALYTLHSTLYTLHSALYTLSCIVYHCACSPFLC